MKNTCIRWMAAAMLLCSVAGVVCAQQPADPHEADHEALRALLKDGTAAFNARDIDALAKFLAPSFAFTGADQTTVTSVEDLKAYNQRLFDAPDAPLASFKIEPKAEILTEFVAPDVGYCYGTSDDIYTLKNGLEVSTVGSWTALCVKRDGQWKVATLHTGVNFYDNAVVTRLAGLSKFMVAGGFAAGLAAGFILALLLARARRKSSAQGATA